MILRCLFIITLLIVLPLQSHALSFSYTFRHLYELNNVSPSPSPSHGVNLASGGSNFQEYCNRASRSCHLKNIDACLTYSRSGPHENTFLFIYNNGENPVHVNIMILPANNTIEELDLPSHQMKKINISSDVDLTSTISLTTIDDNCTITAAAPSPQNHYQKYPSYTIYITPVNGAYLVILLLIIGVILTFYKLRYRARHLEGAQYHELEMGNSEAVNMEENEKENWDQDWDEAWGDEKIDKFGGDDRVLVEHLNGLTNKLPNFNGKRKEWDD